MHNANLPATCSFNFDSKPIRTTTEGDDVWFVAKDVCISLDIAWRGNTLDMIPDTWKGMRSFRTPSSELDKRGGGTQKLSVINEPAVYKLAFRSNKPEADRFTNWVASEVLPAIRRTGCFAAKSAPQPQDPSPRKIVFEVQHWGDRQHFHMDKRYLSTYDEKRFTEMFDQLTVQQIHFITVEEYAAALDVPYAAVMAQLDPDKFETINDWDLRGWPQNPLYRSTHRPAQYITTFGIRKLHGLPPGSKMFASRVEAAKATVSDSVAPHPLPPTAIGQTAFNEPPANLLSTKPDISELQRRVFMMLQYPGSEAGLSASDLCSRIHNLNLANFREVIEPFCHAGIIERRTVKPKYGRQKTVYIVI